MDKNSDQKIELWELLEADFSEPDATGSTTDGGNTGGSTGGSTVTLTPEQTEIKQIQENMHSAPAADKTKVFNFYDENKDGKVDFAEFKNADMKLGW